jgi:hypothetical protein
VCSDGVLACLCRLPVSGPQVRYARSHQYIQAGAGPEDNRQLFFACAPTSATEEQLKELFGRYGEVGAACRQARRSDAVWHGRRQ